MKESISRGDSVSWRDELAAKDLEFEFFFLGLRMTDGVSASEFLRSFGLPMEEHYGQLLQELTTQGLIERDGDRTFLSTRGLMLADGVVERFLDPRERRRRSPDAPFVKP